MKNVNWLALIIIFFVVNHSHAAWNIETVDSTGDVGWYTSLALDSNNQPHISYSNTTNSDLKYAKWNGTSWEIATVDTAGGAATSIAIDNNNNPHISYIAGSSLKYAKWTGSAWQLTTVASLASTDPMCFTSLVLDSNYYGRISYTSSSGAVRYAYYNGTVWATESVTSTGSPLDSSLALLSNNPYITYVGNDDSVHIARKPSGSWIVDSSPGTINGYHAYWPSLKLNSSNNPCISFTGFPAWDNGDLRYSVWSGSAWSNQVIDSTNDTGWWSSLALDSNGYAHISYHDHTNWDLKYATNKSGSWVKQTVDAVGGVGYCTSIKLDTSGNPYIAYYDLTNKDLKYAHWISGNYKISGYVRGTNNVAVSSCVVYLSGSANANCLTADNGYFEFTGLPTGNYAVTPALAGWVFSPSSSTYPSLSSDQTQNFVGGAPATGYFVRGYVTYYDATPIPNVLVSLQGVSPGSKNTDSNGYYEFLNLSTGSYTVIPTKSGVVFIPDKKTYTLLTSNQDSQNFIGTTTTVSGFFIRGYVTQYDATPIPNVSVSLQGTSTGSYTTGSNGYYEFLNLSTGSYTVTPTKPNLVFIPDKNTYTLITSNQDSQNYIGTTPGSTTTPTGYFIRGFVYHPSGALLSSATVTLQGVSTGTYITGTTGYYEFLNLSTGSYTVTPTKPGWVFLPDKRDYTLLVSTQDSQNFLAVPSTTTSDIKGHIRDSNNKAIKDVVVSLSGLQTRSVTTTEAGYYEFTGLPFGNYVVTPQKSGWSFKPVNSKYDYLYWTHDSEDYTGTGSGEVNIKDNIKIIGGLFNPNKGETTTVWYNVTTAGEVVIKIYTIDEIMVEELVNESKNPGIYSQIWSGKNFDDEIVSSGIYIVHINTPDFKEIKKVCVLK